MKKAVIILFTIILAIPIIHLYDESDIDGVYIGAYESTAEVLAGVGPQSTDAVIKSTLFAVTLSPTNCCSLSHFIDSSIAMMKINHLLMTIKYGSTLIPRNHF